MIKSNLKNSAKVACAGLFIAAVAMTTACASRKPIAEVEPPQVQATPAPKVKTKIKYVYVTPPTESAMTLEPYERTEPLKESFEQQVLKYFWPLLTMMATGFAFILILLGEHLILNKQLAKRRAIKDQLRGTV